MEPTTPASNTAGASASRGSTWNGSPDLKKFESISKRTPPMTLPTLAANEIVHTPARVEEAISLLNQELKYLSDGPTKSSVTQNLLDLEQALRQTYRKAGASYRAVGFEGDDSRRGGCCASVCNCFGAIGSGIGWLFASLIGMAQSLVKRTLQFLLSLITPITFYVVGIVVYAYLEGWKPLDTIYFLTVTSTTVGYGDFFPESSLGKLFTCVYALIGITVVLSSLAPLVNFLRGDWREKLLSCLGMGTGVNTDDPELTMEQVNKLISYPRRYALALIGPLFVLLGGMTLHYQAIRDAPQDPYAYWSLSRSLEWLLCAKPEADNCVILTNYDLRVDVNGLVDSFYWSVITMTTIGYGDVTPSTDHAKLLAILYLPLAVIALADAVADVQMIAVRRGIRETDFGELIDECMLRDAVRDPKAPSTEPVLTQSEFLIDQLLANDLVDSAAVSAILRQFKHLTRRGTFGKDEEPSLTMTLCYEEMTDRAKANKPLSTGATAADLASDGVWKWKSYEEWKRASWEPRVAEKFAEKYGGGSLETRKTQKQRGVRTVVGGRR